MKHESDSNDSDRRGTDKWDDGENSSNEFDDAVTSELSIARITGMMVVAAEKKLPSQPPTGQQDAAADPPDTAEPAEPAEPADDETLPAGHLLDDRFEIVALIHSGGMGHVYKAIDKRRHRGASEQVHVAIKMMRPALAPRLDAQMALEREAAKTQHLSHPNIVNVFDFDQRNDQFYLVMEWLDGESVNALLRRTSGQRIEPQFAWRIVEDVARGLQNAHSNNVVHADINPSNIFITETQEVKLLDFGVAHFANDPEREENAGFVWVTRIYASPEVLSGMTPTFEDDIFSLACVAYRLLSGIHPFEGSSSLEAQQAGISVARIPGVAESHWQTISRALSYDRADRPNSASVFYTPAPEVTGFGFLGDKIRGFSINQWLMMAGAAAVVLAGAWWLSQPRVDNEPSLIPRTAAVDVESTLAENAPGEDAEASGTVSAMADLLDRADAAMEEQRLVVPDTDDARSLYRAALLLDPTNSDAAAGLRAISDAYAEQANVALQNDQPQQVIDALSIASETDPSNPAIAIVEQLLAAQADNQLSSARLAAAEGDTERALDLLSQAERFPNVDANAIVALRGQVAQRAAENQLLARLKVADTHILAGKLLTPRDGNAQSLLLQLKREHAGDARLLASMNRQAERLLAGAGIASAAQDFAEATALLDAVDALGVMRTELSDARSSLQSATASAQATGVDSAESQQQASPPQSVTGDSGTVTPSPATSSEPDSASPQVAAATAVARDDAPLEEAVTATANEVSNTSLPAPQSAATMGNEADSERTLAEPAGATTADESNPERVITLADLNIQKYVAPRFPRSARRRELQGFVELQFSVNSDGSTGNIEILQAEPGSVFAASAERAVSQWQFAKRDDVITTRVTLNFQLAP